MIINTERLQLRAFDKKDINSYFNIAQGSGVQKYVYTLYVDSKEKAKSRIEIFSRAIGADDNYVFAIEEEKHNVLIGMIALMHVGSNMLDVSIFIAESCRNRGYAREVLSALLPKLVEMKKSYALTFFVADENIPAAMLMQHIKAEAEKLELKIKEERFGSEGTDYLLQL